MIPQFHGSMERLPRFVDVCEKLDKQIYKTQDANDFQNGYLMSSILANINEDAASKISSGIILNWNDLKTALVNIYFYKRGML